MKDVIDDILEMLGSADNTGWTGCQSHVLIKIAHEILTLRAKHGLPTHAKAPKIAAQMSDEIPFAGWLMAKQTNGSPLSTRTAHCLAKWAGENPAMTVAEVRRLVFLTPGKFPFLHNFGKVSMGELRAALESSESHRPK